MPYEVTFKAVVDDNDEGDQDEAIEAARQLISDDRFAPVSVEKI